MQTFKILMWKLHELSQVKSMWYPLLKYEGFRWFNIMKMILPISHTPNLTAI
jgi:hypothetical protein